LHFRLYPLRLTFVARDPLSFPPGTAANRLRGAFGAILRKLACSPECAGARTCEVRDSCLYALMFEPTTKIGPSGLVDHPRPFVFRTSHLDGVTVPAGETFHFDFHWFDLRRPSIEIVIRAFTELAHQGLGPERAGAELVDVRGADAPLRVSLNAEAEHVHRVTIRFETPTELKAGGHAIARPDFGVLVARVRDRISTLRALYDDGPLKLDFREFGERAARVSMTRCDIRHMEISRRSGRTGQIHPLGGFVGEAEYEGDLTEFIPYLRAAHWTGVGRQTAWGKGALALSE
jgi:hypothetical protein